jgi:hypothetical protein
MENRKGFIENPFCFTSTRPATYQLHDQEMKAVGIFQATNCGGVRVNQQSQYACFALKAGLPFGIFHKSFWKNIDCHGTPEFVVIRLTNLTPPAGTDSGEDFIRPSTSAG